MWQPGPAKCQDGGWVVGFLLNVVLVAGLAFGLGVPAISAAANSESENNNNNSGNVEPLLTSRELMAMFGVCVGLGAAFSALYTCVLVRFAGTLAHCAVWASVAMNIAAAIVSFFISPFLAILWILLAILGVWFWCSMRARIPFAAAHLRIAGTVIRKYPTTVLFAYISLILSAGWAVLWVVALVGVINAIPPTQVTDENGETSTVASNGPYIAYVALLLPFFWGANVFRYTLHVIVAGTVGTWWAVAEPKDPTCASARRACTTSFGSIAFGSFIIAVIQTLNQIMKEAKRRAARNGSVLVFICLCFMQCIMQMIEDLVKYLTDYAFVQVALYGKGFWQAGKDTYALFSERGWTAVFNDVIVDRTLGLSALIFAALSGIVSGLICMAAFSKTEDERAVIALIGGLIGFVIGIAMCSIVGMVIESAVKTIFVAFAERPEAFAATNPPLFRQLIEAWAVFMPLEMSESGYSERFGIPIDPTALHTAREARGPTEPARAPVAP